MKKILIITVLASLTCCQLSAKETVQMGFVNFKRCLEESKEGIAERNDFDLLKNQIEETLEKAEQQIKEISQKLDDKDYLDSLSPEAQQELQQQLNTLSVEFDRYQNQYYQVLNQAQYRIIQGISQSISKAAETYRQKKSLLFILNSDSVFASSRDLDCTQAVIDEMNATFKAGGKNG